MFRATIGQVATFIYASAEQPMEVLNGAGADCFYKATKDVDSGDTKLEAGKTVQLTDGRWFVSASSTEIVVRELKTATLEDATIADDLTVGGDAAVAGNVEIDGELNHDGAKVGVFGKAPAVQPEVKKAELTANELATALASLGIVKIEP